MHNEALEDIEQFDEISNLCDGSDSEIQSFKVDEFQSSEIDITKFKETLFPRVDKAQEKVENQFCKAILRAKRYKMVQKMFVVKKILKK